MVLMALLLTGCGAKALNRSVIDYDESMADLEQKLLLLNIARRHHGQPVHFTAASGIAATFRWNQSVDLFGEYSHLEGGYNKTNAGLDVSRSENPTFSIYPVTGTEFTQQILSPLDDAVFNTIMFQGSLLEEALRLMVAGIELQTQDGRLIRYIENDPRQPEEYREYLEIVDRLLQIDRNRELFVRSLVFDEVLLEEQWEPPSLYDIKDAVYNDMSWEQKPNGAYQLKRPRGGRVVILNTDPGSVENETLWKLNETIKTTPPSFVYVNIEPKGAAGDLSIRGFVRLRSIVQIIDSVAEGIDEPVLGPVPDHRRTLTIDVSSTKPDSQDIRSVAYNGLHYSIGDTDWDRSVFRIMAWLFQSSMGEIESPGLPISIAK